MKYIDKFDLILLDLCNTFMFGEDRFSTTERFDETYRKIGGRFLNDNLVNELVFSWYDQMIEDYTDPSCYENFANCSFYVDKVTDGMNLPLNEKKLIIELIALHEVGSISPSYSSVIKLLNRSHRLGLVSNIWSSHKYYTLALKEAGIYECFDTIVFSSDHGIIKPSSRIFEMAIKPFNLPKNKIVYVGDSLRCDVAGAKNAGLSSVWISHNRSIENTESNVPDVIISDLKELSFIDSTELVSK